MLEIHPTNPNVRSNTFHIDLPGELDEFTAAGSARVMAYGYAIAGRVLELVGEDYDRRTLIYPVRHNVGKSVRLHIEFIGIGVPTPEDVLAYTEEALSELTVLS